MNMEKGILGNAIRRARLDMQLSQEELAEMVGITVTHLKHLESEHRKPSIEVLFRLTETLHISLDNLLTPKQNERELLLQEANLRLNQCSSYEIKLAIALLDAMLRERC